MKYLKYVFATVLCLGAIGCGKKSTPETVPVSGKPTGVGPFDLILSGESDAKVNRFSADINQADGAVDFYIMNGALVRYLVLDSYSTQVTGCSAGTVKVAPVFYSSESTTAPEIVSSGDTLLTTPNVRSKLKFVFSGLDGCKRIDFSLVVRSLSVGVLQPVIESRLIGSWSYGTALGQSIDMFIGTSRIGWLESQGAGYTCDTNLFPSNATESDGGYLVTSGGGLICRYRFTKADSSQMTLNCFGRNNYGCSVPKNLAFQKR